MAGTEDEIAVLVTSGVEGPRLAEVDAAALTDELLDSLWGEVAALQQRRMAHRGLNLDHIRVVDGRAVLFDLRWSDLRASDEVLGADVAELVVALAVGVGAERAVAAAVRGLSADQLARAVPLVQPAVLTPATRRATKGDKALLGGLRDQLSAAAGIEEVHLAPVSRITLKGSVSLVGSMVLGYYVISLAANWSDIWDSFRDANPAYVLPVLILAMAPFFTGAMSLLGAVTTRLSLSRTRR